MLTVFWNILDTEETYYIETIFDTLNGEKNTDVDIPPEFYDILGPK